MINTQGLVFQSTKTYTHAQGLSCAFRQWRAESHCRFLHGYALEIKLTFRAEDLNSNYWVVDFGGLKDVKAFLVDMFDHTTVVAHDDPHLETFEELYDKGLIQLRVMTAVGCEAFAGMVFREVDAWLKANQKDGKFTNAVLESAEVREHSGNSAICKLNIPHIHTTKRSPTDAGTL